MFSSDGDVTDRNSTTVTVMPYLTKRWASFFIFSTVVGVVLIVLVGWANNQEGFKVRNKVGQFFFFLFSHRDHHWHSLLQDSFGADSDFQPTWTNPNQVLVTSMDVNSFDPNRKTGPAVSLTDWYPVSLFADRQYSLALSSTSCHTTIWPHRVSVMSPARLHDVCRGGKQDDQFINQVQILVLQLNPLNYSTNGLPGQAVSVDAVRC